MNTLLRSAQMLAGLGLLLSGTPSWAQPTQKAPAVAPSSGTDEVDELFNKGKAAFDAGKLAQAYELFQRAWAVRQTHDIAGNLAQIELTMGKKREAAEHIAFSLAHFPPTMKTDRREKMRAVLDGLRKELGVLRINVNLPDAKVVLDGKTIGISPIASEVFVDSGPHEITATLSGYQAARASADAPKGSAQDVTLTLVPVPVSPPPGSEQQGPAGARKPVIIAGAVLGGVGIAMGAIFAAVSNAKAGDAETARKDVLSQRGPTACADATARGCADLHDLIAQRSTFGSAAAWSFISGGAVGVATVVYALAAPKGAASAVQIAPVVTGQHGGLLVRGMW